jgi:hypothetical protein
MNAAKIVLVSNKNSSNTTKKKSEHARESMQYSGREHLYSYSFSQDYY